MDIEMENQSANPVSAGIKSQRGLTLVEIIVVLVILTVLLSFLTGGLFNQGEKAKAQINGLRMKKLQDSIGQYQLMFNTLPSSLQSLTSCSDNTAAGCVPVTDEESLKDAWGTPFNYVNDGRSYTLKSLGADRRDGGSGVDQDVSVTGP